MTTPAFSAGEFGAAGPLSDRPAGQAEATSQIESVLAALGESWNRHDMPAYSRHFTADADFVNVVGMHWRGQQEIQDRHTWLHQTIMRNGQLSMVKHAIRFLSPEVAIAHSYWEQQGHEEQPGWNVGEIRRGIITLVLLKQSGAWRVTAAQNTDTIPLPGMEESA